MSWPPIRLDLRAPEFVSGFEFHIDEDDPRERSQFHDATRRRIVTLLSARRDALECPGIATPGDANVRGSDLEKAGVVA